MSALRLSPGEEALITSIIEHIYPDPKAGSVLPVEQGEQRAARGLERKGIVVLSQDERGLNMTFTVVGQAEYEQRLATGEACRSGQSYRCSGRSQW